MKFPKTIRFDNSDLNIFENPSEEGEWAISGAFEFSNDTKENLKGKRKQSFSNGFLGLDSFGRSTFVSIASIDEPEKIIIVKKLAELFVQSFDCLGQTYPTDSCLSFVELPLVSSCSELLQHVCQCCQLSLLF